MADDARGESTRRNQVVAGVAVALALCLGLVASARVVATDLREGPWWAVAGAVRGINALAVIVCVLIAASAATAVLARWPRFDAWGRGYVAATVDDLEEFERLVVEAELIAPRSWAPLTNSPGYYQLTTRQVTGGAINPDDLPRVAAACS